MAVLNGIEVHDANTTLQELADRYSTPVLLIDHRVSRRKQVTMLYRPGETYPLAYDWLQHAITDATDPDQRQLLITCLDQRNEVHAIKAILSPLIENKEPSCD